MYVYMYIIIEIERERDKERERERFHAAQLRKRRFDCPEPPVRASGQETATS